MEMQKLEGYMSELRGEIDAGKASAVKDLFDKIDAMMKRPLTNPSQKNRFEELKNELPKLKEKAKAKNLILNPHNLSDGYTAYLTKGGRR
ncbi:hypothetical protein BS78_05G053400 [Paspalum vaginatum]|nr:hypothetical protein BS78_05G053400 [Paspalum vaginatum]